MDLLSGTFQHLSSDMTKPTSTQSDQSLAVRLLSSYWADAQVGPSLRWAQSFCWFCHVMAHMSLVWLTGLMVIEFLLNKNIKHIQIIIDVTNLVLGIRLKISIAVTVSM